MEPPKRLYNIWHQVERQPWFLDDSLKDPFTFGNILAARNSLVFFLGPKAGEDPEGLMYASQIIPGVSATAAIAIWGRSAAGRVDLALTAARAVVKQNDLHKLYAHVALPNTLAHRFVNKMGFVDEGILRSALCYNGRWVDVVSYGLLAEELGEA